MCKGSGKCVQNQENVYEGQPSDRFVKIDVTKILIVLISYKGEKKRTKAIHQQQITCTQKKKKKTKIPRGAFSFDPVIPKLVTLTWAFGRPGGGQVTAIRECRRGE